MNICFTVDEKFIPQFEVTMTSILSNANKDDEFNFYLVTDGLKSRTKKKLTKKYSNLVIVELERDGEFEKYPLVSNSSYIVYLRLKIPSLLSNLDKILYLDSDLIVTGSLKSLYDTDISDFYVGAVADFGVHKFLPKHIENLGLRDYFNAGVLLMNLKAFREQGLEDKCYEILTNNSSQILFQDQDVLNIVCDEHVKSLETTFNCQVYKNTDVSGSVIVHYVGQDKPWSSINVEKSSGLYWRYVCKTRYLFSFLSIFGMGISKKYRKFFKYLFKHV